MDRRQFLSGLAVGTVATALPQLARAQAFPSKPIRIVGGFGPGSSSDTISRFVAPRMQELLGQPIIIDNIQGAAGHIATTTVARASADGYTLLMATNSQLGTNPHLFPAAHLDPTVAFTPVTPVANIGLVIVAQPAAPARDLLSVLDAARRGQTFTYGTPGVATPMHFVGEMLSERANGNLVHVPYKGGGQMVNDLVAGQIALGIVAFAPAEGFVRQGRLKVLAACGSQRLAALPEVPAIAELVPGVSIGAWCALMAPAGTPAAACQSIARAYSETVAQPKIADQLKQIGNDPIAGTADSVTQMIKTEYQLSGDLIRRLKISVS